MGPPKKGTKEYSSYLKRQAARKRRATIVRQRCRKEKMVKPYISAAVRKLSEEHANTVKALQKKIDEHDKIVEGLTRRSNRHMNEAAGLRSKAWAEISKKKSVLLHKGSLYSYKNLSLNVFLHSGGFFTFTKTCPYFFAKRYVVFTFTKPPPLKVKEAQVLKEHVKKVTAENLDFNKKLNTALSQVESLKAQVQKNQALAEEALEWQTWYYRVCRKASGKLVQTLNRWGFTRPPGAPDRCWGGGQ
jgi:hypothetical protein